MNLKLCGRITEANLGVYNINGFMFNLHKMEVNKQKDFKILMPIFKDIAVGDVFTTDSWCITRIGTNKNPVDVVIRANQFDVVLDKDAELSDYVNGTVIGIYLCSDKCYLRDVGPDKKPFFMATLKFKDSTGGQYELPIVGFGRQALKLSTIKNESLLKCTATLKQRKGAEGYELAVYSIEVIKEDLST